MRHSVVLISIAFACANNLWGYGGSYECRPLGFNGWPDQPFGVSWPFGDNSNRYQNGGFADQNVRRSYGAGNENMNYGQNVEAEKDSNANVDLNAGQGAGIEAWNSRNANEYVMRNENACSWSGSDYFRRGNTNSIGNNNMNNVGWGGLFTNNGYRTGREGNRCAWGF